MAAPTPAAPAAQPYKPRYIDIGINLTDPVYSGLYHGTQRHPSDLPAVIGRAVKAGCRKLIVTGSDVEESRKAVQLAKQYPGIVYATIGVHPCSCEQFTADPERMLGEIQRLAMEAKEGGQCVAFGEIGLDYDRLTLCPKDVQLQYFAAQLDIAVEVNLPLFLHSRAAHADFIRLLNERAAKLPKRGVVHSFTGTLSEMQELVAGGWYIGVNGCSLKTAENLEVVRAVPLDKIMLETDGPWCEMRASHASAEF
ncbi:Deoxyribonuclease Tat-D, partial [Lachnellula suecica]